MNEDEAVEFAIRELGRHQQRNEIIRQLCENAQMTWPNAEIFLKKVELEHKQKIAVRQSPLIATLGGLTMIPGLALALSIVVATLQGYIILFLTLPIPYLGNVVYFLTGLAMIAGGLRGMWTMLQGL